MSMDRASAVNMPQSSMSGSTNVQKQRQHRWVSWCIYLISICLLTWLFVDGASYYLTPYNERPFHPDYRELRPAGSRGLMFGIIGASMMVLMLIYSVRKRTKALGGKIPLRSMLNVHIYCGIIGPLFIVLHTSFKVQGLVAVSFWSMVAVALSGFFGRYLYSQIPRNIQGNELGLKEIEQESTAMTKTLKTRFNLDDPILQQIESIFSRELIHTQRGTIRSIVTLMFDDLIRPFTRRSLWRKLRRIIILPKLQFQDLFELSFKRTLLRRRLAALANVQKLFHYWHVIHKPFAIIMYLIMFVHIGVALWMGYAWFN